MLKDVNNVKNMPNGATRPQKNYGPSPVHGLSILGELLFWVHSL